MNFRCRHPPPAEAGLSEAEGLPGGNTLVRHRVPRKRGVSQRLPKTVEMTNPLFADQVLCLAYFALHFAFKLLRFAFNFQIRITDNFAGFILHRSDSFLKRPFCFVFGT